MEKNILSDLVISQKNNNLLVNRYFVVGADGEVEVSEEDANKNDFFNNFSSNYKVSGRAILYPKGSKGKSIVVFNIDTDIDDIKKLLDEFLVEIREVLNIFKGEYGFRYTASIEINNKLLRDVELNNDPMNIGHILMNDDPSKQVTVMEKSAQMYGQTPPYQQELYPTYQAIEAPPSPQVPQATVINAYRILPDGRLEVVPGYYVKPIEEPIVVDTNAPQGDRHAPRNRYEVRALNPEGQVLIYSITTSPDEMSRAITNIRRYTQEYQQQLQQMPPQMPPQMLNIQSQALQKNKALLKRAFGEVFVDDRGVLRKINGNPIEYPVGVRNSLSKLGDVYGLKYIPQRHEFVRRSDNQKFLDAKFIYLAPKGQSQGQLFPIRNN